MSYRLTRFLILLLILLAYPYPSPAPLIYRAGEGWIYEPVGAKGEWMRSRAKGQLDVANQSFEKKDYKIALRAARRTVSMWPLSDYAPEAQFLIGKCYEAKGNDEKAFKEYQKLLEKYPKFTKREDVMERQYEIANRYLGGKWFRIFGVIPLYRSMEKTSQMFEKIVKNGPFSEVAPQAQLKIGTAQEKRKEYPEAVKAYEKAADKYHDRPQIAAEALFKAGYAHYKQALKAEYDQNSAAQAIATFTDFLTLYPNDPRVPEARKYIAELRTEQSRGAFEIAKYYEKRHHWSGAEIYYNEAIQKDPTSPYAEESRKRLEVLKEKGRIEEQASAKETKTDSTKDKANEKENSADNKDKDNKDK